jgi:hypothetical protein
MEGRNSTDKKIDLLKAIEFANDFDMMANILLEWKKKKPSDIIDKMIDANIRMYYYSFNMEESVRLMRKMVSEYRADKLRAVERARKADDLVKELEEKLKLKL